jgi:biopolymer transport protein ExbD
MGMSGGGSADEATPNINVTPLIDVLLVLLIIFMVISPLKPTKFEAKVPAEPKPEDELVKPKPNELSLVVIIDKTTGGTNEPPTFKLNKTEMGNVNDTTALQDELRKIFDERERNGVYRPKVNEAGGNEVEKTIFIKAPETTKYGDVVKIIDAVKVVGASPIGLQVDKLD